MPPRPDGADDNSTIWVKWSALAAVSDLRLGPYKTNSNDVSTRWTQFSCGERRQSFFQPFPRNKTSPRKSAQQHQGQQEEQLPSLDHLLVSGNLPPHNLLQTDLQSSAESSFHEDNIRPCGRWLDSDSSKRGLTFRCALLEILHDSF